jgi:hypothetical protein
MDMNNLQVVLLIQRSHCHDLKKEKVKVKKKNKEHTHQNDADMTDTQSLNAQCCSAF